MAGHSKWANIQHRKNRQDAKRGSLWTKIIREVTVAARDGGAATLLSLVHAELPTDWAPGYGSGWHAYLDRLDAELGDREPPNWAELSAALRPLYQPDRPQN